MTAENKIDPLVCEWAETRLLVPPGIPNPGWFGLRQFYNDYRRFMAGREVVPINVFSLHIRAIPGLDVMRIGAGSVLVGAVYEALMPTVAGKLPQIPRINRAIVVKLPRKAKRLAGTRSEVYVYRGALKAAADAVGGDAGAALRRIADTAGEDEMRKIGRAISKTIKKARGLM